MSRPDCRWQRRRLAVSVGSGDNQDCEAKEERGAEERRKKVEGSDKEGGRTNDLPPTLAGCSYRSCC